jgi:4-hydroxy-tetrahydrodipicolinate synthase
LVRAWRDGRIQEAVDAHKQFYRLFKDLFIEPNPVPIKYALSLKRMTSAEVRLPLCEMTDSNKEKLRSTLTALKIL